MPGRTKRNSWSYGEHVVFEHIRSMDHVKLKKVLSKEVILADTLSQSGHTPMTCACVEGNEAAVEILIQFNHNINQKDNTGNCPIHYAAGLGKENILKMLLNHNADINMRGKGSNTALHCAIQEKRITIVKLLLDVGIEIPLRRNSICINPFDLAAEVGSQEIHDMLEQALRLRENSESFTHLLRSPRQNRRSTQGYIGPSIHLDDMMVEHDPRRVNVDKQLAKMQRELESHKEKTSRDIKMLQTNVKEIDSKVTIAQKYLNVHDETLSRIEKVMEKTVVEVFAAKDEAKVNSPGYIEPVHTEIGKAANVHAYIEPIPHSIKQCQPFCNNKTLSSSYISPQIPETAAVNDPTNMKENEAQVISTQFDLQEAVDYRSQQTQRKTSYGEHVQSDQLRYIRVSKTSKSTSVRPKSEPCISPGRLESIPLTKSGSEERSKSLCNENHYSVIDDKDPECLLSNKEKENIQKNFIKLKTQVNFDKIKDQMFEEGILTANDIISWNAKSADDHAILVLLEKVYKGPRKYKNSLQSILWEEGLNDVAELLS